MVLVAVAAAGIVHLDGVPGRVRSELSTMLAAPTLDGYWKDRAVLIRMGVCHYRPDGGTYEDFVAGLGACVSAAPEKPNLLVVGDSLGADFRVALARAYPDANVMQLTMAGCQVGVAPRSDCARMANLAVDLAGRARVDAVLLASRWIVPPDADPAGMLSRTVEALSAHSRVVLVGPAPEFNIDVPALLGRMPPGQDPDEYASVERSSARDAAAQTLRGIARATGAMYYDRSAVYCGDSGTCPVTDGRQLLIADFGHLTPAGMDVMAQRIRSSGLIESIAVPDE